MTWSVKQGIEEAIGFIEQYVFSVLDVCDKLLEEKKIAAGGPECRRAFENVEI